MSIRGSIKRYMLILEKVSKNKFPSLQVLASYLQEQGFETSKRSLERDIQTLRDEFAISLRYDYKKKGYYIDSDNELATYSFFHFLEMTALAAMLSQSVKDTKEALSFIQFESIGSLKGIELLPLLLKAIKEKKIVTFTHHSYETNKVESYTLYPYLLKQYQNRWYVIGMKEETEGFLTFGIDRMQNVSVSDSNFLPAKDLDPASLFTHTIGLVYSTHPPIEIKLKFTAKQGRYIKSLPLHPSQVILQEDEQSLVAQLFVVPNFELKQKLWMMGDSVKVLHPAWLADEIAEDLQRALRNYL